MTGVEDSSSGESQEAATLTVASAAAFAYSDTVHDAEPILTDDVVHHFQRVRRIGPHEIIALSNGQGFWRFGQLDKGRFQPTTEVFYQEPTPTQLTVGFAPTKGERPELVIQKLTELGVDHIVIIDAERSVVRWDAARQDKALSRFSNVVASAGEQSRRLYLPTIEFGSLPELLGLGAVVADMGGGSLLSDHHMALIGPEGGWSDRERREFDERHIQRVSVAPGILRAETAAIAVGAAMVRHRGINTGPFESHYR